MSKKCKCTNRKDTFCKHCSRFKMVILLRNNFDHLKTFNAAKGKFVNPVWYSVLSKDHKPLQKIETAMLRRLANHQLYQAVQIVEFRDNQTDQLLTKITF